MTFLFECISSGDFTFVNASDLYHAIETYKSHYKIEDSEKYHIYVRID